MSRVCIYSTGRCPICVKTKQLLEKWGIPFKEVCIDQDHQGMREFARITQGARMVPQLTIDNAWIGGFTELTELHMEGKLEPLIGTA